MSNLILPQYTPPAFSGVKAEKLSAQTLTDLVSTPVIFTTEIYDTDNFHHNITNPERFYVPAGAKKIEITVTLQFAVGNGLRQLRLLKNNAGFAGSTSVSSEHTVGNPCIINMSSGPIECANGDYFTVTALQTSGGNLDIISSSFNSFTMKVVEW